MVFVSFLTFVFDKIYAVVSTELQFELLLHSSLLFDLYIDVVLDTSQVMYKDSF